MISYSIFKFTFVKGLKYKKHLGFRHKDLATSPFFSNGIQGGIPSEGRLAFWVWMEITNIRELEPETFIGIF